MASRLQRLNGWRRLWLVATAWVAALERLCHHRNRLLISTDIPAITAFIVAHVAIIVDFQTTCPAPR